MSIKSPDNPQKTIVHGVFISIFGTGTLITGKSGSGKSDLALSLLDRGHSFIADDAVEFFSSDGRILIGRSPKLLKNFLAIRGLGVINLLSFFGAKAVLEEGVLSLVIQLEKTVLPLQEIKLTSKPWILQEIAIPSFFLPLSAERPREVLIESLVKSYQLMQKGENIHQPFIRNHHQALGRSL